MLKKPSTVLTIEVDLFGQLYMGASKSPQIRFVKCRLHDSIQTVGSGGERAFEARAGFERL